VARRRFKARGFIVEAGSLECCNECSIILHIHETAMRRYLRQSKLPKDLMLWPHPTELDTGEQEVASNVIFGPWEDRTSGRAG
jgi:hypothetical protein